MLGPDTAGWSMLVLINMQKGMVARKLGTGNGHRRVLRNDLEEG